MKHLLFFLPVLFILSCSSSKNFYKEDGPFLVENTTLLQDPTLAPFYHGVASGDPYPNSVVLWTRVTPKTQLSSVEVEWEIATDKRFSRIIGKGTVTTGPEKDYTVKVIAERLESGRQYYYRFKSLAKTSMVGMTKTAPRDQSDIKLAVVSCSNIEFGYFNAYAAIAEEQLDAVLHLGDYIYEYGPNKYGDTSFIRKNIPPYEILSLQDYRDRYSQYRLDPDLQKVHGSHPFINIWDDHEITNNAYVDGAQNHQPDEGDYALRKAVARQVYYEWLPIREGQTHYRKFGFGQNVDLFMLDERLAGRTVQPDSLTDPQRNAPDHAILGEVQMNWLLSNLKNSKAKWKIIGNQVIFSYSDWGYKTFGINLDAWDGYPREQAQLTTFLRDQPIQDVIFVTGDTHTAWAFEATNDPFNSYDPSTGKGAVAIEFGVTSTSSGNSNERFPDDQVKAHEKKISNSGINPHLKYVNMRDHGYLLLDISSDQVKAEYKIVPTLKKRTNEVRIDETFFVKSGYPKLNRPTSE